MDFPKDGEAAKLEEFKQLNLPKDKEAAGLSYQSIKKQLDLATKGIYIKMIEIVMKWIYIHDILLGKDEEATRPPKDGWKSTYQSIKKQLDLATKGIYIKMIEIYSDEMNLYTWYPFRKGWRSH